MFQVFFINFGYAHETMPKTVAGAIDLARRCCFEANIIEARTGDLILSWSPLRGCEWRDGNGPEESSEAFQAAYDRRDEMREDGFNDI